MTRKKNIIYCCSKRKCLFRIYFVIYFFVAVKMAKIVCNDVINSLTFTCLLLNSQNYFFSALHVIIISPQEENFWKQCHANEKPMDYWSLPESKSFTSYYSWFFNNPFTKLQSLPLINLRWGGTKRSPWYILLYNFL